MSTTDDKPTPDLSLPDDHPASAWRKPALHPAPWRWGPDEDDGDFALIDADGRDVAYAKRAVIDISVPSAHARELIAAAPEIEALLREEFGGEDNGTAQCMERLTTSAPVCGSCRGCKAFALLSRIDAAADAGKR